MALNHEDLVRLVQDTISTSECDNPITFEPPDWVIRAMRRAYDRGRDDRGRVDGVDWATEKLQEKITQRQRDEAIDSDQPRGDL